MIDDQARALLIVGALLSAASGGAGFVGGRASAPVLPVEVRFVHVPAPPALAPLTAPVAPVEAAPLPAIEPPAKVEAAPLPQPRPKIEAKPKALPKREPAKPRPVRKPTASECAQLKIGMLTIGRAGVYEKAKDRNYTKGQVDWAIAACGL